MHNPHTNTEAWCQGIREFSRGEKNSGILTMTLDESLSTFHGISRQSAFRPDGTPATARS